MPDEKVTFAQLQAALTAADAEQTEFFKKYEGVNENDIPIDDLKAAKSLNVKLASLTNDLKDCAIEGGMKSLSAQHEQRMEQLRQTPTHVFGQESDPQGRQGEAAMKSFSDQFMEEVYAPYMAQNAPLGRLPEKPMPNSPTLKIDSSIKALVQGGGASRQSAMKALITGASTVTNTSASGGVFVRPSYDTMVELPRRPLFFRDMVREMNVDGDTVFYVKFVSRTNNAAVVAEGTSTSDSTQVKPESALELEVDKANIVTIANWMPVSRRALANAGQVRQIIEDELRNNVEHTLETEMISGPGTGEHLLGVEHVTGYTDVPFVTDIKTTLRKARTAAMKTSAYILNIKEPVNRGNVAYLMHPDDVESYDLDQDAELRYYTGGPMQIYAPLAWGVPIVQSEAVTQGTAWMADWSIFTLYDRQQTATYMTDSHADFFVRNLMAILTEGNFGMSCKRPSGLLKVHLS